MESLRALLALSVQFGLQLHQIDVTTASLNGELEEEVYMQQPKGFVCEGQEHLVCKQSIYELKQSPRCWNMSLDKHLKEMGLTRVNRPVIHVYTWIQEETNSSLECMSMILLWQVKPWKELRK